MTDIVERLRREGVEFHEQVEAADKIEQLRALCRELFELHGDGISSEYLEELERRVRALEPKP